MARNSKTESHKLPNMVKECPLFILGANASTKSYKQKGLASELV